MTSKPMVDLGEFYREYSHCHSFHYQRDQLYRFGKAEGCDKQWDDYCQALRAKFTRDADRAHELIESTHLMKSKAKGISSPTIGVIWAAKDQPSWD
mmetsp:Transcript_9718/g.12819  ORF Transcript_9718/g.12819 Transcript_9718/m.12819 type:complete len:96 (+) Transcript_9718:50-337(+)|eukprot:CAMPEP_0198150474 /NCGR_PEP_ID=MMETSP1443-20131203/51083_1 /TAXON_ID=186043 /ORGANISM="Entomoneis sp., Strain CCMP2396" /LENGTH=95 /DNA_ID=CAMNT_0043815789 /DNA_START=181 /DNA_END=468 /DNA_ORIENTATION=-